MYKVLLVPALGMAADAPVFETAHLAARMFDAHVAFLHVRVDVREMIVAMASSDMGGGGISGIVDRMEKDSLTQEQVAHKGFEDFRDRTKLPVATVPNGAGVSVEWRTELGDMSVWLAAHGRSADLLVVGRARDDEPVAMDVLEAGLMDTGRPLLIVPAKAPETLTGTVTIAWKDTPEAARAVAAALPFIDKAERVVILSVQEDETTTEESCERLLRALHWHNKNTTRQYLRATNDQPLVQTLIDAAANAGTSLLVMGGYSHSRLREVVFGGFTRHIMTGTDLPVLMAH